MSLDPSAVSACPHLAQAEAVDFDTHDPAIAADPFPVYARLRAAGPVVRSRAWGGFWVAAGHPEVAAAARDRNVHSGRLGADGAVQGISIPSIGQSNRLIPLELNTPECQKYRRLLSGFYSKHQVEARLGEFRRLVADCVDEVAELGGCDIVKALTERVPSILTMRDIGIAEERWLELDTLVHDALVGDPAAPEPGRDAAQLACLAIIEEIEARRDGDEQGGLVADLLAARIDGEQIEDEAIVSMMYLLLLGIHPTSTLAATALWYLARHPELRRRLVADRSLIPAAVDEFLRWVSPVQATARTAAADLRIGEVEVSAGDRLLLSWASANRDERVFADPERVDLDRDPGAHIAFGGGPHYCLGASLVRTLCTLILDEVLDRMPDYEIADESAVEWFPDLSSVYGVNVLPIRFAPSPGKKRT